MSASGTYRLQITSAMRLSLAERTNFIAQVAGMLVNNGFILLMWFMFFAGFRRVGGWQLADVALLLGLAMSVVGWANVAAGGYRDLAARILRGELDALLTQPLPVLPRLLAAESLAHGWGDVLTGAVLLATSAGLRATDLPMLVLGLACGLIVFLSCAILFASLAFWLRGARSFTRDLVDFVVLFSMYPGSIWQGPLKLLVHTLLPAGFIVLMPVRLLREPGWPAALGLAAAALVYAALAGWVFQRGLRRYRQGASPTV